MGNPIEGLEPKSLWNYFYEISQIPRASKKEEQIREYVKNFAVKNSFGFTEDEVGNIVIKVPAKEGYENSDFVVLQGHLDMVCEKNKDTEHNFDKDPIKMIRKGDWMAAEGTTLGADNGIGIAAALSIVTDEDVVHGPIEILCTIDEETGMTGVNALGEDSIKGRKLVNMDSEEDGVFYIGCAGGQDTVGVFNIKTTANKKDLVPYELRITGLKGGHSGLDIHIGRANAIKIIGTILSKLEPVKFRLASITGGSKRNAIPREAEATVLIPKNKVKKAEKIIKESLGDFLTEYQEKDGGLEIVFSKKSKKVKTVFTKKFTRRIIKTILALPHGVIAMNPSISGLVNTSTNLATVSVIKESIVIGTSQRSSLESAKNNISNTVKSIFGLARANSISVGDGYPGWKPNLDSELLKLSQNVYERLLGKRAEMKAIHAGLECGIFSKKYPGIDMVSFGPTITGAHSPDEQVNIEDVNKFYTLLKEIIKEAAL
ncbi:aminoacyl-histidine dipeptidase [Bacteroidota bacterium]